MDDVLRSFAHGREPRLLEETHAGSSSTSVDTHDGVRVELRLRSKGPGTEDEKKKWMKGVERAVREEMPWCASMGLLAFDT